MGSRKNWPKDLADRCNAVGWAAELVSNGHWRAKLPDGRVLSWAESPSDTNGYKAAFRKADRYGLSELENRLKLQREKERLERIERDRAQNGVPEEQMLAPEPTKKEDLVTKYGYIELDGMRIGIADIAKPVMHQHNRGGEPRRLDHSRELLLVDGTIRYQCLKLTASESQETCARHFATSAGLVVHWARGSHLDALPQKPEPRDLGASVEPNPAEPKPDTLIATKHFVLTEVGPQRGEAVRPLPVDNPGVMARMEDLGQQLLDVHFEAQRLANHAQDLHKNLADLAKDVHRELASDEVREKAEKFDRMIEAANQ